MQNQWTIYKKYQNKANTEEEKMIRRNILKANTEIWRKGDPNRKSRLKYEESWKSRPRNRSRSRDGVNRVHQSTGRLELWINQKRSRSRSRNGGRCVVSYGKNDNCFELRINQKYGIGFANFESTEKGVDRELWGGIIWEDQQQYCVSVSMAITTMADGEEET